MKKPDVFEIIALPVIMFIYVCGVLWILFEGIGDNIREHKKRKKIMK